MSVNLGTLNALLAHAESQDKDSDNALEDARAFSGRLTRAMAPTPMPPPNAHAGAGAVTKGVPLVDVMALETLPLRSSLVACAPRFWQAADLVTPHEAADEQVPPELDLAKDAKSKQSFDDRRQPQNWHPAESVLAPGVMPARPLVASGTGANTPATLPGQAQSRTQMPPPSTEKRGGFVARPMAMAANPHGPTTPEAAKNARLPAALPPSSHAGPAKAAAAATAAAPAARAVMARILAAAAIGARPPVRDDGESANHGLRRAVDSLTSPPTPQVLSQAPASTASSHAPAATVASQTPAASADRTLANELPLSHVQWRNGEARVAVQTESGVLSLHVRVKDGVADVMAGGPAAKHLDGKTKELTAELAKEGLALGRFAAVDAHAAASLMGALIEDEGEPSSCQEPDEDDGTGSAEAGVQRRVSGEPRRLRPSRRVHVKA